jgi:hypothetical protein
LEAFQGWLLLFKNCLKDAIFGAPYFSHAFFWYGSLRAPPKYNFFAWLGWSTKQKICIWEVSKGIHTKEECGRGIDLSEEGGQIMGYASFVTKCNNHALIFYFNVASPFEFGKP